MKRKLTVTILTFLAATAPQAWAADVQHAFVVLDADNYAEVQAVVAEIEASGGHVRHIFPNSALVADGVGASLAAHPYVAEVRFGEFATDDLREKHGEATWLAAQAWLGSQEAEEGEIRPEMPVDPIENDVLERGSSRGVGDVYYPTSEYMAGTVAVGLVLPECTGGACTEVPWTPTQLAQVFSEVVGSTDWWIDRATERGVPLTFVYDEGQQVVVPTEYEPINMNIHGAYCESYGDVFIWVEDVLYTMGYSGECFEPVYEYLADLEGTYDSDWSLSMFVANSLNDEDGRFADGMFASAFLGGPFFHMTYDNGNYTIDNMDVAAAHETGHIFWAFDQYAGGGYCWSESYCEYKTGYLDIENQNCEIAECLTDEPSIMKHPIAPFGSGALDPYGAGQVGWWDTDEDGLQDVIDTHPAVGIGAFIPDPTEQQMLDYSGYSYEIPHPNLNHFSWNPGAAISINAIDDVLFRVDEGSWQSALPIDGAFDNALELYAFATDPLDPGTHVIEVTAVNSVGNYAETTARDTVTVVDWVGVPDSGTPYVTALHGNHPNPFNPTTSIRYELAEPGVVTLSVHSISGRLVRVLEESVSRGAGRHTATWDGRADGGSEVASGVYFYCLDVGREVAARKMILLK